MTGTCINCEHNCHCTSGICVCFNKDRMGKDINCFCSNCNCGSSNWGAPTEYME